MPPTDDRETDLARHRAAIDALDREILARLNARARARAGDRRAEGRRRGLSPRARGAGARARCRPPTAGRCPNEAVAGVFRQVMSACLALEQTLRVAYLGPAGHVLARGGRQAFRRSSSSTLPCATIDEVFRAAESGQTDYAVVPVENSTEGAVGRTLDLMCQTPLVDLRRDPAADPPEPAVERRRRWTR